MASTVRAQRLAERIRQDLSELLQFEVTDPALSGVTITDVTVDREMAFAKIFVSVLEGSERKEEVLAGLERAKGYFRYQLSQKIELRSFPQLRFKWDATPERAERIESLFSKLARENKEKENTESEEDSEKDEK